MVNLDAMQRYSFDYQQARLDEAARWRLLESGSAPRTALRPSWRRRAATALRRTADRLEPAPAAPRVGLLRALAHREISVDQALRLLEANGHLTR
ncbi:MAG TPA: hypothetical protein VFR68_14180 [Candidatus Dormibacteraeota bacterium]|nr:hypothetical protein [Candidatus Dormibacteraeota bacterium]